MSPVMVVQMVVQVGTQVSPVPVTRAFFLNKL